MKKKSTKIGLVTRRKFIGWLGKAVSLSAAAAVFPGTLLKNYRAMARPSAKASAIQVKCAGGLLLKNGLIVDGTGQKAFAGNLLIKNGFIQEVTPNEMSFKGETLDCFGKIVAPGIIDMHSHNDWILPVKDHAELKTPFIQQGVTTFIGGNCGFGVAGFKPNSPYKSLLASRTGGLFSLEWDSMTEYFAFVQKHGMSHNLANLAGYGTTRASIRGLDSTPLKPDEVKELLFLLEEAMDQGAYGVSLGLQYEPGVFAKMHELKQVAELVKRKNKIMTVHMKAYSALSGTYPLKFFGTPHNILALQDMINLTRETGVKMQLSHLIFVGTQTWKNYQQGLELIDKAIDEGLDIKFDTYAYHCGTSIINVVLPEWFLAGIPDVFESRTSLLRLRAELTLIKNLLGFGYEDIQITHANHPDLDQFNGMFLKDIAEERGLGEFENFVDFARKSKGRAGVLNHRYSNLEQVKAMIAHPASLFQTDARVSTRGTQNPAAYGNFPRILQYARDFRLISLEEAIYKMTGASAERFGIKDRGVLKKNAAADLLVFDWDKIKDNNTDEKTDQAPSGIEAVFINGVPVFHDGKVDISSNPGKVVIT